jgi:hypothetical protein
MLPLARVKNKHCSRELSNSGWIKNALSSSEIATFVVCNPVKEKNNLHSLQSEIQKVQKDKCNSLVKSVYIILLFLFPLIVKKKYSSMSKDVYIMF